MRQLIVLGGGGFSMESSPLLDQYFLDASGKACPRICFLPTASGDADAQLLKFYAAHARYRCQASHLSLFRPPAQGLASVLLTQDAIFIGGGNTRAMLALWREWGVDQLLRQAYLQGCVLGGISAGMLCWFEAGLSDSCGMLAPLAGLGWLRGGACPHLDGEAERRPRLRECLAAGQLPDSWGADDGAALHFVDEGLHACMSSRPNASVWRFERLGDGSVSERRVSTRYLG